jgi:phage protein D
MSENKNLTPLWIIYVDGKRLDPEHEGALRKIEINERLNGISTCSVLFDTSEVKIRDKKVLSLESDISIHLGYKDDIEEIFKGDILGFKVLMQEYGSERLLVAGSCVLHRLSHGMHFYGFENKSYSEIVKAIVDGYSLKGEIENFGDKLIYATLEGKTDYDYIMEIAHVHGKNIFSVGEKIIVGEKISIRNDEIILEWGKNLISFEGGQNIGKLISDFTCLGFDLQKEETFEGKAGLQDITSKIGGSNTWVDLSKGGNGKFASTIVNYALNDVRSAQRMSAGQLQSNSFYYGTASGSCEGNYKIRPGMGVSVKMTGEAFDGEYLAESVSHCFDHKNGYITRFILKRNMSP